LGHRPIYARLRKRVKDIRLRGAEKKSHLASRQGVGGGARTISSVRG
jgi:hypothetical protein